MADEKQAKTRFRRRGAESDPARFEYDVARKAEEAHDACAIAEEWLADLAQMAWLDHEGNHAVGQAQRNVRAARKFLEQLARTSR